jgi:hypothetical protein
VEDSERGGFYVPHPKPNQDPLENTFGAIHSYFGFNNNPAVGQFIDAQNTSIINDLAYRGLCGTNCEDDVATLLDNYNRCSGHLILLNEIPLQVMARKHVMFLRVSILVTSAEGHSYCSTCWCSVVSLTDRCFVVSAVMHAALHLKYCYEPISSYISRSTVIQNSLSPILLRSWLRLSVLL